jgi:hypothetical protein
VDAEALETRFGGEQDAEITGVEAET